MRSTQMRKVGVTVVTLAAVGALLAAVFVARPSPAALGEHGRAEGAFEEAQEQEQITELRLEALEEAVAAGEFGEAERIRRAPAPGWTGEQLMNRRTDDWEPATAADPNDPFVYLLTTRYGEPKPCPGNCPVPHIALEISRDGGRTWSDGKPLCACKGSGQFDPIIEVVPDNGDVYAVWMNGYNVVFQSSDDHGKTWTAPVPTWGNVSWNDKPALATSDNGKHVYVSWNGPTGGDPWIAQSHDFGETWSQTKVVNGSRYFFAYDADVLPDGTVIFSESSLTYTGPGASAVGKVHLHAFISRDRGTTWTNTVVDRVEIGVPCTSTGCYADFYDGHTGVSADEDGDLVFVYEGAVRPGGPRRIHARRSTDAGRTWGDAVVLSRRAENATSPAVEATGNGDVRAWFYETNDAPHRWNVWYRSSTDGGRTWSKRVLLSDADSGAGYKHPDGFKEVYGDYGEIAITSEGKTFATWGESFSYLGPGGTWFNLGR
ncbi:MAG: exo-alpha-sialidase [Actinomycetota bacterium]